MNKQVDYLETELDIEEIYLKFNQQNTLSIFDKIEISLQELVSINYFIKDMHEHLLKVLYHNTDLKLQSLISLIKNVKFSLSLSLSKREFFLNKDEIVALKVCYEIFKAFRVFVRVSDIQIESLKTVMSEIDSFILSKEIDKSLEQ